MSTSTNRKILFVVTGADTLLNGRRTGVWLEEFAVPFLMLTERGFEVDVASPKGGRIPIDPHSLENISTTDWENSVDALEDTVPLAEVHAADYAAVFLPGGHGTMIDFPGDLRLKLLLHDFATAGKVIGSVCHGPAGLVGAKGADGRPLVAGRRVTSFTDAEERASDLVTAVPFLLESRLREEGADFVPGEKWAAHAEVDGKLVTGQNPASSKAVATAVADLLA